MNINELLCLYKPLFITAGDMLLAVWREAVVERAVYEVLVGS